MKRFLTIFTICLLLFSSFAVAQDAGDDTQDAGILPDSPLYGLKIAAEAVGTFFTFGQEKKANRMLGLAEKRIAEANAMADKEGINAEKLQKAIDRALKGYEKAIKNAERHAKNSEKKAELEAKIQEKNLKRDAVLAKVLAKVPEQAKQGIERAMEARKSKGKSAENRGKDDDDDDDKEIEEIEEEEETEDDDELEVEGVVSSISDDALTLEDGLTFVINADTEQEDEVTVGDKVEVEYIERDGSLVALEIELEDDDKDELEVEGIVSSISNDALTLEDGKTFVINADTEIKDVIFVGDDIEVEYIESEGVLVAVEIEKEDSENNYAKLEIEGMVVSFGINGLDLEDGTTFVINADTEVKEGVELGDRVEVTYIKQAGTLIAIKIEKEGDDDDDEEEDDYNSPITGYSIIDNFKKWEKINEAKEAEEELKKAEEKAKAIEDAAEIRSSWQ